MKIATEGHKKKGRGQGKEVEIYLLIVCSEVARQTYSGGASGQ
jgi:hypothetical protein